MPSEDLNHGDSIEADIKAAVESLESGTAPAVETVEPTTEAAPVETESVETDGRTRDEHGRFAKQTEKPIPENTGSETGQAKAAEGKPPAPPAASPTPIAQAAEAIKETMKPPPSWKPAAREKWAALPPEVQQEAVRIDREVKAVMQESAEARKGYQQFRDVVAPYEAMIRAEGADPFRAVSELLQTAAALRTAAPGFKAKLAADMVKKFNIPIDDLDKALAGEAPAQGAAPTTFHDPRLDGLLSQIAEGKQRRAQQERAKADREIEEFAQSHEFFDDLREEMGLLIETANQRGREMSLEQAYKIAAASNDEISKVVQQRETQKSAATASAAMQRARVAASTPKSSPAMAPQTSNGIRGDGSVADALKGAFAAHGKAVPEGW